MERRRYCLFCLLQRRHLTYPNTSPNDWSGAKATPRELQSSAGTGQGFTASILIIVSGGDNKKYTLPRNQCITCPHLFSKGQPWTWSWKTVLSYNPGILIELCFPIPGNQTLLPSPTMSHIIWLRDYKYLSQANTQGSQRQQAKRQQDEKVRCLFFHRSCFLTFLRLLPPMLPGHSGKGSMSEEQTG